MAYGETSPLDLPRPIPGGYGNRLFLFVMRRMASAGVNDANAAYDQVSELLGNDHALGALTCLQAVAQAHADLGRPLDIYAAG